MSQKVIKISLLFTFLSLLSSALNFLYYPVTARLLSLAEFGDVQVGVAFIMQAAALFTSLNTLALFFAAQKGDQANVLARLERLIIGLSLLLALVTVVFSEQISAALQLHDTSLLYMLAIIFILNIPAATWLGSLQGAGQFVASGVIAVISSALKIIAGVIAIALGFGAMGALVGILAGSFIILPLAYATQKKRLIHVRETFRPPSVTDVRLFLGKPLLALLFLSLFLIALSSTLDVIAAKALLDPETAGLYAQLSTAGKIAYFATVPIAIISFERLMKQSVRRRHVAGLFGGAVTFLTILVIIFEPLLMRFFFGLPATEYRSIDFSMICVAFGAYSLSALLVYGLISQRQVLRVSLVSSVIFLLPLILLLSVEEQSITAIARSYMLGQLAALLVAGALQYTGSHE